MAANPPDRAAPDARPDAAAAAGGGGRLRPIAVLDLARFEPPAIPGDPPLPVRAAWYLASVLMFQNALALLPSPAKAAILRLFGARVGRGVVIKPRVAIKSPWFLSVGDHVWLGEGVWIDNHTAVTIGANACLSQGVVVFTGNHNWNDPRFAFFCRPVSIGAGVWVTAFQRLAPGTVVPDHVAVVEPRA